MIGRVYKIIVNCSNEIYIGSTVQECRARWQEHKGKFISYQKGKAVRSSSFDLFEKWGIDNCKIILIKEYEVVDRKHLEAYEQLWINKLKPINHNNPFRIEWLVRKNYYRRILERNPNLNQEKYQKSLEKHPNINKEQYQKRLGKDPEFYKKKVRCEPCQIEITQHILSRHQKTKKHQKNLSN